MHVRDWLDNTLRAQEIMQQISHMLNSNKQFRLDDFFSLHISHIQDPGQEAGNQRIRKRTMAVEKLLHLKNDDDLRCAHAIVTIKAYFDFGSRPSDYDSLKRGLPVQEKRSQRIAPRC